ncbi:MAG: hypothetical protein ACTSWL_06990 [Promethearchaeota archaeon]
MIQKSKQKSKQKTNQKILKLVREFNSLVKNAISGPDCTDPDICHGDCCFVNMDVPKALVEWYIENGWASIVDFDRGNRFSFKIKMDLDSLRCNFFDFSMNGCKLHTSGMKVPQCWVYPTGLDPNSPQDFCKKAKGWKIIEAENAKKANQILEEYMRLCLEEAEFENSNEKILKRLNFEPNGLDTQLSHLGPSKIAGVNDGFEHFSVLHGESYNLALRTFCDRQDCNTEYFQCPSCCPPVIEEILQMLIDKLPRFIQLNGFKQSYPFFELLKI